MAKIILIYVVTLFMIFPFFWNHGNATTPCKLGVRHNVVTGLLNMNKVNFYGSAGQYSLVSETPCILGARYNAVTSLLDIKEVTSDDQSGHQYFTISKSSSHDDHANVETPCILGAHHNVVTNLPNTKEIASDESGRLYFSISKLLSHDHANVETPRILGACHNVVTNLPDTKEVASDDQSRRQYFTISKLSSLDDHANVETPRILGARHKAFKTLPDTKEVAYVESEHRYFTISKYGELGHRSESPIAQKFSSSQMWQPVVHEFEVTPRKLLASHHNGVTSLSNIDETTIGGSEHNYSPISSSSAHTHRILQTRSSGVTSLLNTNKVITLRGSGVNYSPISSSLAHTQATNNSSHTRSTI
ncbi:hypothetical protein P3S67_028127 [Capsicum chacoense]